MSRLAALLLIMACPCFAAEESELSLSATIQSEDGRLTHWWRARTGIVGDRSSVEMLVAGAVTDSNVVGVIVTGNPQADHDNICLITDGAYLEIQGQDALSNVLGTADDRLKKVACLQVSLAVLDAATLRRLLAKCPSLEAIGVDVREPIDPLVLAELHGNEQLCELSLNVTTQDQASLSTQLLRTLLSTPKLTKLDLCRTDMSFWTADFALQMTRLTWFNVHAPATTNADQFWGSLKFLKNLVFLGVSGSGVHVPLPVLDDLAKLPFLRGLQVEIDNRDPGPYCLRLANYPLLHHLNIGSNYGASWDDAFSKLQKLNLQTFNCHEYTPAVAKVLLQMKSLIALRVTIVDDGKRLGNVSSLFEHNQLSVLRIDCVSSRPPTIGTLNGDGRVQELYVGGSDVGASFDSVISKCASLRVLMFGSRKTTNQAGWEVYSALPKLEVLSAPLSGMKTGNVAYSDSLGGIADPTGRPWSQEVVDHIGALKKVRFVAKYAIDETEWAGIKGNAIHEMRSFFLRDS